MPLRNRVDPFGDLHAVAARGLLTGNRGCLVDDEGTIVRRHQVRRWITCRTEYRGWRHPLAAPRRWTPVFFLDEAVALAAGHRPCALCRRDSYRAYGEAVAEATGGTVPSADDLDLRLHDERRSGRGRGGRGGGSRATAAPSGRRTWPISPTPRSSSSTASRCSSSSAISSRSTSRAGVHHCPGGLAGAGPALVLTPATSVAALRNGFRPELHPSATRNRSDPSGVYSS